MKNLKRPGLLIILVLGFITSFGQTSEIILKTTDDSIANIKKLRYEVMIDQNLNTPMISKKTNVILERNPNSKFQAIFIIESDSVEIINDGRFRFEINHLFKTVKQEDLPELNNENRTPAVIPDFFKGYFRLNSFLKSHNPESVGNRYWVLNFKTDYNNNIDQLWINKKTFLPEIISQIKPSGELQKMKINYLQVNDKNIPWVANRMAKFIDTYELLPLERVKNSLIIDRRDSLIGKKAQNFTLLDLNGNKVSLSDFNNRLVLLDFWEPWCGPCKMSMPHLEELKSMFQGKGLTIIGLTKSQPSLIKKVLSEKKVTYVNLIADEKVLKAYKVLEIPQYCLIARDGRIMYITKSGYEKDLEDLLIKEINR